MDIIERLNAHNQPEVIRTCSTCHQEFWCRKGKDYKICKACWNDQPNKKYTSPDGSVYVHLTEDDPYYDYTINLGNLLGHGWIREARLSMMKHLGRTLTKAEQVIHIDGDKQNNSPSNLVVRKVREFFHPNFDVEPDETNSKQKEGIQEDEFSE